MKAAIHQALHVATEGRNRVQAVKEQSQLPVETGSVSVETREMPQMMVKNRDQAVIQQAVATDLGLEESHSIFPLTSQETSGMQAGVQQSLTDMGRARLGQSATLQTAPGSMEEANAQSGVLHATSLEVDMEEAHLGTSPLIPKTCSVLSLLRQTAREDTGVLSGADAVPHHTHVTMEAGRSAMSEMKATRTAQLDLEKSQSLILPSLQMASNVQPLKQVTPYIIGATSASTVSHQPSEVAINDGTTLTSERWETVIPLTEQRVSNVQTVTHLPTRMEGVICDQEETRTGFVVTRAVASEVDMNESCSLASFLPQSSSVRVVTNQTPRLAMEGTKPIQTQSPIVVSQLPQVMSSAQERPYMFMEVPDSVQTMTAQSSVTLGLENPHGPSSIQGVTHHIPQSTEKPDQTREPQMAQAISFGEHYNTVTVNSRGSLKPLTFVDGEDHTPLAASTPINAQTCVVMDKEQSSLEDSAYATATPTELEKFTKETSILVPESESGRVAFTVSKVSKLEDTEQKMSPLNISHNTLQTLHGRVGHQTPQTKSVSQGDSLFATASEFSYDIESLEALPTSNTEDEEIFYTPEILENKPEQKLSAGGLSLPKRNYREEIIATSEEEFFSAEDSALVSSSDSVTSMTSRICKDDKNVSSSQVVHLENRSEIRNLDMQREKSLTASRISTIGNLPCVTANSAKGSESIQNDNYLYKKGHVGNIISCAQDPNVVVSSCSVPRVTLEQEVSEETYKEKEKTKQAERGEVAGRESSRSRSVDQGLKSALPGNISLPHGNEGQPIASTNVIGQSALAGFGRSTSSVTEEYLAKLQDRDSAMHTSALSESQYIPVKTKVQNPSNSSKNEGKRSRGKEQGKVAKGCIEKLENFVFHETTETDYSVAKVENAKLIETADLPHLGKLTAPDTGIKTLREDKAISFEENKSISSTAAKVSQRKEVKKNIPNEKKSDPQVDSRHATTSTSPTEMNQHLQKRSPDDVQRKLIRQVTHPPHTVVTGFSNTIMQPQEACEQTDDKTLGSHAKVIYKAEQQKPEYTANYSLAKLKRSLYSRKLAGQVFNQMTYPAYEPEREQVQVEDHSTLKKEDNARAVPASVSHNVQGKFDSKSEKYDDTQASFQARLSDDKEVESKTTGVFKSFGTRSSAVVSNQQEQHQTKNYGKTLNMNVLESKITELKSTEIDKDNIKKDNTIQEHSHGIEVTVSNYSSKSTTTTHEDKQTYVVDKSVDNPKLKLTSEAWRGQFLMEQDQSDEWGASDESITFIFMNPDDERPSEDNLLQANVTQSNGSNYRSSSDLSHVGLSFDTSTELKQAHFFDLYKAKCGRLVRSTSLDSVYWNLSKIQVAKQKTEMQRTSSLEEVVTQELEDILARGRRFSSVESDEDDITEDASTVRQNRCHIPVKTHGEQTDSREVPEASRRRAVVTDADDQAINTSSSGDDDVFAKSPFTSPNIRPG
ncbi:uncharacterized protein LOC119588757 [Penaeus monodon]|uniref:uncharacterized protein LOC119588757 n=1 Tax=Penaeus monodon TaxID=6687 RepID=UPI0018A76F18|nr:uncharacterized protein LOC119588757 [Penaeus monodon]